MVKSPSKQRDHLYDMLGVRVIISDRAPDPMEAMVSSHFDLNVYEKNVDTEYAFDFDEIEMQEEEYDSFFEEEEEREANALRQGAGPATEVVPSSFTTSTSIHEEYVVTFVGDIIRRLSEWEEDPSRFKNYVANPKASGYQSMHMTLMHGVTDISLEVQLRSVRMHIDAEYGRASHANYKALALPASVTEGQKD